jgi:hypothetical protein
MIALLEEHDPRFAGPISDANFDAELIRTWSEVVTFLSLTITSTRESGCVLGRMSTDTVIDSRLTVPPRGDAISNAGGLASSSFAKWVIWTERGYYDSSPSTAARRPVR